MDTDTQIRKQEFCLLLSVFICVHLWLNFFRRAAPCAEELVITIITASEFLRPWRGHGQKYRVVNAQPFGQGAKSNSRKSAELAGSGKGRARPLQHRNPVSSDPYD